MTPFLVSAYKSASVSHRLHSILCSERAYIFIHLSLSHRWTPEVPPISLSSVSAPNPHYFFGRIPRAGAQRARVFLRLYLPELVIQAVGASGGRAATAGLVGRVSWAGADSAPAWATAPHF